MKNPEFVGSVVLAIVTALVIAFWGDHAINEQAIRVKVAMSYAGLIMLFLFGFLILAAIASGKIDISQILTEKGTSGASMSRFQLMIFTFVISLSLFLIVVSKGDFPTIPTQILELLGISATTYGVGKGIQATSNDTNVSRQVPPPSPPAPSPNPPQP